MWWLWWTACAPAPVAAPPTGGTEPSPTADTGTPIEPDPDVATFLPGPPPANVARVLFVGDSITYGTSVDLEDRWTVGLSADLEARFGPIEFLNVSYPGQTVYGLLHHGVPVVEDTWGPVVDGPVLVIGTLGTGDNTFGRGSPAGREWFLSNLSALLDLLQDPQRFPDGASLYLANIYDQTDGTGHLLDCWPGNDRIALQAAFAAANEGSLALARERGFAWVDTRGHFRGHGGRFDDPTFEAHDPEDPTLWYGDCVHPDPRGHDELRRLFLAAIEGVPFSAGVP